jgi:hypothetical protein
VLTAGSRRTVQALHLKEEEAAMVRSLIAAVAALVVCSSGTLSAENFGVIYSNMSQEIEFGTYDCAG